MKPVQLPSNEATFLNVVNECANASLPHGPWDQESLINRCRLHETQKNHVLNELRLGQEVDEPFEEFLCPFFIALPGTIPTVSENVENASIANAYAKASMRQPIGFLRADIVNLLKQDNEERRESDLTPVWDILFAPSVKSTTEKCESLPCAMAFSSWVNQDNQLHSSAKTRHEHLDRVVRKWKDNGLYNDILGGWRNENYAIYGPKPKLEGSDDRTVFSSKYIAFHLERAACGLFSFATFGVHMTAYVTNPLRIWVAQRSPTKQTWPNYLDNSVAGGITAGDSPFESMVRECLEEASLPESIVHPQLRSTSCVSYCYKTEQGFIQPEIQYCYDLELPEDVVLKPNDSEVSHFSLLSVEEVVSLILKRHFKPNCALVIVDFLIRHGFVSYESDTEFTDLIMQLHHRPPLPLP